MSMSILIVYPIFKNAGYNAYLSLLLTKRDSDVSFHVAQFFTSIYFIRPPTMTED